MKVRRILFPVLMAMAVSFSSCGEDDPEESCDGENIGEEMCSNDFSAVATFCTDGENNSYYTYGGDKFECDGVDANTCADALDAVAVKMIEAGCETGKSAEIKAQAKITKMAENLLVKVRQESISN
ncbi:MAG: hypothetical protein PF517_04265 [Salinivirgaceae bacterium]|jgi:hypothetical protein|nr:hypothetical protein [Salinivirgaceae bacterium]